MFNRVIVIFSFILIFSTYAYAEIEPTEIYKEQLNISGADKLPDKLPKDASNSLKNIGINSLDFKQFTDINLSKVFDEIIREIKNKSSAPIKAITPVLAIILLSALVESVGSALLSPNMSEIMTAISSLCICICIVNPILKCISSTALTIKGASEFIMYFIPVMAGIMIILGQTFSASSYQVMMTVASGTISYLCANLLIPLTSTMLGVSIISSISQRLNLDNICNVMHKFIKWSLAISVSIFTSILALQSLVSTPADNIGGKAAKLALSGFVPIVGSALGDAFSTVKSCIKLLKSGVGAFGIIAGGIIFLPAITECCIWISVLSVCCLISDVLTPGRISVLLKSVGKVMQIMLAVIFSCMTVLIISTVIIILIGNGD